MFHWKTSYFFSAVQNFDSPKISKTLTFFIYLDHQTQILQYNCRFAFFPQDLIPKFRICTRKFAAKFLCSGLWFWFFCLNIFPKFDNNFESSPKLEYFSSRFIGLIILSVKVSVERLLLTVACFVGELSISFTTSESQQLEKLESFDFDLLRYPNSYFSVTTDYIFLIEDHFLDWRCL